MTADGPLLQCLIDPTRFSALGLRQWDLLLRQARRPMLSGRLATLAHPDALPPQVAAHLRSALCVCQHQQRTVRWEIERIAQALAPLNLPVVLLKGAAYLAGALPNAPGRFFNDVDILVPREALGVVEKTLLAAGWQPTKLDDYDQRYYRRWMHELPPLRHRLRGTTLDVHHTIVPETSRLRPDPRKLIQCSTPLPRSPLRILAPTDLILHSATHLFQEGEFPHALRDLVDLDLLLRHFDAPDFAMHLRRRAEELDLTRPLFYALRFTHDVLGTPLTPDAASTGAPGPLTRWLMDRLIRAVVTPALPESLSARRAIAQRLLFLRGHFLRMPLSVLLPHLAHQGWRRVGRRGGGAATDPATILDTQERSQT